MNQIIDSHEIWYERDAITGEPTIEIFVFIKQGIVK